jgi:hypothetical protein
MPKDQPETHQDQESQKLVDRIEKKASAAQRLATPKRNLKVVKWIGTVPAVGVCSYCCMQFKVPTTAMKSVADAHESLRVRFTEHKCKPEDASRKR